MPAARVPGNVGGAAWVTAGWVRLTPMTAAARVCTLTTQRR